jgi:hypothetical protein
MVHHAHLIGFGVADPKLARVRCPHRWGIPNAAMSSRLLRGVTIVFGDSRKSQQTRTMQSTGAARAKLYVREAFVKMTIPR